MMVTTNTGKSNLIQMNEDLRYNTSEQKKDVGKLKVKAGDDNMIGNETYVSQKDLNNLEEKVDLKLSAIQKESSLKFDSLSAKIDTLPTKFENMLLKEREYQNKKQKESNRYIFGTIFLGILGILVGVAGIFF